MSSWVASNGNSRSKDADVIMLDLTAIADKPWPFVRGYLTKALDLGDRLDSTSDDYALGIFREQCGWM